MYTLILAAFVALFTIFVPTFFGISAKWTVLPGLVLGVVTFIWISRRVARRVQAVVGAADKELNTISTLAQNRGPNTPQLVAQRVETAISLLKRGFVFEKWQIGVGLMLNARIGMLMFTRPMLVPGTNVIDAIPFLEKARVRGKKAVLMSALWPAWAMLGIAYWRRKQLDRAREVFDAQLPAARKEGLFWSIYAWILSEEKLTDDAISVLARAKESAEKDPRVAENLTLLQNGKRMKMRGYDEQWYQFGLEQPKIAEMQQARMPHPRTRSGGVRRR